MRELTKGTRNYELRNVNMKKFLLITILLLAFLTPFTPAFAGPEDPNVTTVTLVNPLGGDATNPKGLTDLRVLLGNIIAGAMGILGSMVLAVFVYGGFLWLTSAGNTERVKKGLDTMMWAAIGLFLIFGAYAILGLVLKAIGAKGGTAPVAPVVTDVPVAENGNCSCVLKVSAFLCEINEEVQVDFGETVQIQQIIDAVDKTSCPIFGTVAAVFLGNEAESVEVKDAASCSSLKMDETDVDGLPEGVEFSIQCEVK